MAALIVILGSVVGLIAGLVGWLVMDLSFLAALAIWVASGPVAALLIGILSLIPHGRPAPTRDPSLVKA